MREVSLTQARRNLRAVIKSLRRGSPVLIVDRGRPLARLVHVERIRPEWDARFARQVAEGLVRPPRDPRALKKLLATKPVRLPKGVSVLRALLEERREGR